MIYASKALLRIKVIRCKVIGSDVGAKYCSLVQLEVIRLTVHRNKKVRFCLT